MKNIINYIKQIDPSWFGSAICFTQQTRLAIFLGIILPIIYRFLKRYHDKQTLDQILSHPKGKNIKSIYSNGKELKIEFKDGIKPKKDSP